MLPTRGAVRIAWVVVAALGCGSPVDKEDPGGPMDEETPPCESCVVDGLDSAVGCGGVYNPDQMLDYHLTMSAGDWSALKSDMTYETYYPAKFQCGSDAPLNFEVGVRHKRSGGIDKPGIKIDFNKITPGGSFFSLKKFSLENGVSSGSDTASPKDAVAEYLAWRMMVLSGAISSRAAFARLFVNGDLIGVYVNVEQVDKRFLRSRGKDDEGWLYKHSGGVDDGYKTNETTANPYEDRLCFFDKNPCAVPADLETYLPTNLDIEQMLAFGGINALISNSDAPLVKVNNFYWYDDPAGAPRLYMPWDLDTTLMGTDPIFASPGTAPYTSVLFSHWEDDYDRLLTSVLAGPLTSAAIVGEIDRGYTVAGAALEADPSFTGESIADVIATLKTWWTARHSQISSELATHAP